MGRMTLKPMRIFDIPELPNTEPNWGYESGRLLHRNEYNYTNHSSLTIVLAFDQTEDNMMR